MDLKHSAQLERTQDNRTPTVLGYICPEAGLDHVSPYGRMDINPGESLLVLEQQLAFEGRNTPYL
jgi:hypothetical protein